MTRATFESRYQAMERIFAEGEGGVCVVESRDGTERGYSAAMAPPYTGSAGYSTRLRVVWGDGRVTLCCTRGMDGRQPDDAAPGGFRHWRIR